MQREEIRFMVERDGSAKAIVFSQFTSFLDLINYTLGKVNKYQEQRTKRLPCSSFNSSLYDQNEKCGKLTILFTTQCGVSCVQLVGSMSMAARDAAINKFKEDPDCRVFLMSLKAGGVALNLTVASHVSDTVYS